MNIVPKFKKKYLLIWALLGITVSTIGLQFFSHGPGAALFFMIFGAIVSVLGAGLHYFFLKNGIKKRFLLIIGILSFTGGVMLFSSHFDFF